MCVCVITLSNHYWQEEAELEGETGLCYMVNKHFNLNIQ